MHHDPNVALSDARSRHEAFVEAAGQVDDLLVQIEAAVSRYHSAGMEFHRALRRAGRSDEGRIPLSLDAALRSAAWKRAPGFADRAHVLRAQQPTALPLLTYAVRTADGRLP